MGIAPQFGGRGRAVITASNAMEHGAPAEREASAALTMPVRTPNAGTRVRTHRTGSLAPRPALCRAAAARAGRLPHAVMRPRYDSGFSGWYYEMTGGAAQITQFGAAPGDHPSSQVAEHKAAIRASPSECQSRSAISVGRGAQASGGLRGLVLSPTGAGCRAGCDLAPRPGRRDVYRMPVTGDHGVLQAWQKCLVIPVVGGNGFRLCC
jgi:hypothetical protein